MRTELVLPFPRDPFVCTLPHAVDDTGILQYVLKEQEEREIPETPKDKLTIKYVQGMTYPTLRICFSLMR